MKKFYLIALILFSIESMGQDSTAIASNHEYVWKKGRKTQFNVSEQIYLAPRKPAVTSEPTEDKVFLDFVGTGDIQKSISDGSEIQANTSLGALFERYAGPKKFIQSFSLEALINVATTADTIKAKFNNDNELTNSRNFGTYILNPVSAKQSFFLNWNTHFGTELSDKKVNSLTKIFSGLNIRIVSSNNVWNYADTAIANVSALSGRIGLFHEFIPDNYRTETSGDDAGKQKYSITWGLGYSFRGIYGDIKSSGSDNLRKAFLGSSKVKFGGLETNFTIRLKNIRAEFQIPIFSANKSVPGLTNTQFLFSIKFVGGIPLKIDKKGKTSEDEEEESEEEN